MDARKGRGWISRIRLGALIGIVALGVLLIPTLIAGRPGQTPQTGPTYRVLHRFTGGTDGAYPPAGVIYDPTLKLLVGTTYSGGAYGFGKVFGVNMVGQETVLYSFTGGADGAWPWTGLIRDASGNLYGTTAQGGDVCYQPYYGGCGVVFRLDPAGNETVLHTFTGPDGAYPYGGLIRDSSGNLYGTTLQGGLAGGCNGDGCGVVFKVDPAGNETVLHAFAGGADGSWPAAGLIRDAAGNLYGTTQGTVFKVSPTGHETVLYVFTGGSGGGEPVAGLVRDAVGNLYGTAKEGGDGSACSGFGCGVVFKLTPTGQETVLYTFTGGADGALPEAGLVRDSAGNLYGTTAAGGDTSQCSELQTPGCGVVFKLTP